MRAKPDGLLGLFILYFSRYYFFTPVPNESRDQLVIGSFPLEVETAMCGYIALRVIIEIIISPSTFKSKIPQFFIYLAFMFYSCFDWVLFRF